MLSDQVHLAIVSLGLIELAYWLAFAAVVRVLHAGLAGRDWFGIVSGLSLALMVFPWSGLAASELAWLLFDCDLAAAFPLG
ncbi:MAG TPA: hypothetical protein VEU47_10970 [Candidatus Cybelea sp.]|nr:hypothetical protein [Candidatus Cybelea sp.]